MRANLERIRARAAAPSVEVLAAVKYVPLEELGTLAEAGITLAGENRAQDLEAKAAAHAGGFRWHFIGQLQSRKVKQIAPARRADPLGRVATRRCASSSATARRRPRSSSRSTSPARTGKAGIAPGELGAFIARCPVRVVGLMTMPPFTEDPEASRPLFAAPARARAASTDCAISRWERRRTTASRPRRARRSCAWARPLRVNWPASRETALCREPTHRMAFRDTWHRTLVYFGLAEDRDTYDEEPADDREPEEELENRYRERPNVRRLSSRRRRDDIDDIFADDSPSERGTAVLRSVAPPARSGPQRRGTFACTS